MSTQVFQNKFDYSIAILSDVMLSDMACINQLQVLPIVKTNDHFFAGVTLPAPTPTSRSRTATCGRRSGSTTRSSLPPTSKRPLLPATAATGAASVIITPPSARCAATPTRMLPTLLPTPPAARPRVRPRARPRRPPIPGARTRTTAARSNP